MEAPVPDHSWAHSAASGASTATATATAVATRAARLPDPAEVELRVIRPFLLLPQLMLRRRGRSTGRTVSDFGRGIAPMPENRFSHFVAFAAATAVGDGAVTRWIYPPRTRRLSRTPAERSPRTWVPQTPSCPECPVHPPAGGFRPPGRRPCWRWR